MTAGSLFMTLAAILPKKFLMQSALHSVICIPKKVTEHGKPMRPTFPANDILRCIGFEALLVAISASNMAKGIQLTDEEKKRLMVAAGRINAALEVTNGQR